MNQVMESQRAGAYEALFRSVFEPLVGALAVAAGSRDAASDAVQDAFVQAHRHWDEVRNYENPAAWIRRAAVNRIANQHRSRQRFDRAVAGIPVAATATGGADPSARLIVAEALGELSEHERLVICLYYLADLPVTEVADACGITAPAVKSILHRARKSLGRTLGGVR